MRLLLLIGITTLYLALPSPAQSAVVQHYESAPLKSNIINKRDDDDDDDEEEEGGSNEFHWSYEGHTGPRYWGKHYPFCGGQRQSPIDLYNGNRVRTWNPFQFFNYNVMPTSVKVTNNGHSAMITVDMPIRPYVRGGNLNGEYEFAQLHFHWGSNNPVGSEHLIRHNRYPCEVHLVHYRKVYNDTATAVLYKDGLAVLGVMFTITAQDNPALAGLITGLANITLPDQEVAIHPIPLSTFLPNNRKKFYRYQGSLTTPPCNEVVVWTVFDDKLHISAAQMAQFRTLKDANADALVDNYRPAQSLGSRQLYFADLD